MENIDPYIIKKTPVGDNDLYWNVTNGTWLIIDKADHIVVAYDDQVIPHDLVEEVDNHLFTIDVNDFQKYETVWSVGDEAKVKMNIGGVWPVDYWGNIQMPDRFAHVKMWNDDGDDIKVQMLFPAWEQTFSMFETASIFNVLGKSIGGKKEEYVDARSPMLQIINGAEEEAAHKKEVGWKKYCNYTKGEIFDVTEWKYAEGVRETPMISIVLYGKSKK